MRVDADGGEGDYLAQDGDKDAGFEGAFEGAEVGEVNAWEGLVWRPLGCGGGR